MTQRDISSKIHALDKKRREHMALVMAEYDVAYRAKKKELQDDCGKRGHIWRFTHLGPLSDPWFVCQICQATKVELDKEEQ